MVTAPATPNTLDLQGTFDLMTSLISKHAQPGSACMCLCIPQGLRQACPPADELADNGRGWLSEHGMVVQPSAMPAARQDACVLQSLVGRMLQQPVLAASMYALQPCLPACSESETAYGASNAKS